MKNMKNLMMAAAFGLIAIACNEAATPAQVQGATPGAGQSAVQDDVSNPNVVQIAVGSADHTTLVAALKAADYVDVLTNVGPFTVFAPTNDAFSKLPAGTVEGLVKPENQRKLRDILEYHVLLGVYRTNTLANNQKVGTAEGHNVIFTMNDAGETFVNGAKILASIPASNGIIHVLDGVLLPE